MNKGLTRVKAPRGCERVDGHGLKRLGYVAAAVGTSREALKGCRGALSMRAGAVVACTSCCFHETFLCAFSFL